MSHPSFPIAAVAEVSAADVPSTLPLAAIEPSPTNPRKHVDAERLAQLAETIKAQGVLQPLLVRPWPGRPGTWECVDGHRRRLAAERAGLAVVPVIARDLADAEVIAVQLITGETGEPLTAIEQAEGFRYALALREAGQPLYTVETLAERTGQSARHVRSLLGLLRLPGDVQRAVDEGSLPMGTAIHIAAIPVDELREKAARDIMPNELRDVPLTREAAAKLIQEKYTVGLINAPFDVADATLDGPEGRPQACTGCEYRVIGEGKNKPMCVHPVCFRAKCNTAWERVAAKAKAAGTRVLTEEETAEVFEKNSPTVQIAFSSPYVDVDSKPTYRHVPNEIEDQNLPTWRELITTAEEKKGIRVPIVLARDRTGKQWQLVQLALCIEAARAIGEDMFRKAPVQESINAKDRFDRDSVRGAVRKTDDFAAKKKAEADAAKKRSIEGCAGMVALHAKLAEVLTGTPAVTEALLTVALQHAGADGLELLAKAMGLKLAGGAFEHSDAVQRWFAALPQGGQHAAIPLLLIAHSMRWNGLRCEGFKALAAAVKLDVAAIEAQAAGTLAEKKGAKKKDAGKKAEAAVRGSMRKKSAGK